MCNTFKMIGSLTSLKLNLEENSIHDFKSLKEVMNFQSSYPSLRQQLITYHEELIVQEKNMLYLDLQQLDKKIQTTKQDTEIRLLSEIDQLKQLLNTFISEKSSNLFQKLRKYFLKLNYRRQLNTKEFYFALESANSVKELIEDKELKNSRHEYIISNFKLATEESSKIELSELDRKKAVIDKFSNYIYGALGEQKVVKTLEALSDDYFLINDFSINFFPAIYNRRENDYIKSIQIDHLLVAPSGVFIIETKNWSDRSLENLSLRSPVQQIKRTNFALFHLLNNEMSNIDISLDKHHWGDKKISIKNLIVLTNSKPKQEFQYVKVLTLNELLSYINYFKPIFSNLETRRIANFLLSVND